ncbi:hypothetical protein J3E71DRAFT_342832 [Bipolaris maydis]|nr:hypothetical protein J3E73DRAFT_375344 [Bipolaris maydis]KAJ6282088.1 hypothetical protein J3E71DRAFT_342832 [Bipolaris maydis]
MDFNSLSEVSNSPHGNSPHSDKEDNCNGNGTVHVEGNDANDSNDGNSSGSHSSIEIDQLPPLPVSDNIHESNSNTNDAMDLDFNKYTGPRDATLSPERDQGRPTSGGKSFTHLDPLKIDTHNRRPSKLRKITQDNSEDISGATTTKRKHHEETSQKKPVEKKPAKNKPAAKEPAKKPARPVPRKGPAKPDSSTQGRKVSRSDAASRARKALGHDNDTEDEEDS